MRKLAYTACVAFWSVAAALLVLRWLGPGTAHVPAVEGIALADVAEHATIDDCWMAIEGTVYDLTAYVPRHPTPPSVLAEWCGREATEGMRTKGRGRDHSASAWAQLERYALGPLAE